MNIDFSEATCIFVYLVPEGMQLLREGLLAAIQRGVRVVTYGECRFPFCIVIEILFDVHTVFFSFFFVTVFSIPDVVPTEVSLIFLSLKYVISDSPLFARSYSVDAHLQV